MDPFRHKRIENKKDKTEKIIKIHYYE